MLYNLFRPASQRFRKLPALLQEGFKKNTVVTLLLIEITDGDDDLRTWVVKGNEQPFVPVIDGCRVITECQLVWGDRFQRIERDRAEGHDHRRGVQIDLTGEKV